MISDNIKLNGKWLSNDGGNEGIRIDNYGKVGIGTTSSGAALEVAGKVKATELDAKFVGGGLIIPAKTSSMVCNADNTGALCYNKEKSYPL